MSSDWRWERLGDYCTKIGSGATPRGGKDVYLEQGPIALIRSQNVYNDGFVSEGLVYINEAQAQKLDNVELHQDDILLNITGDSVARVCMVNKNYLPARVNQHVSIIRPNPSVFDARFVRYFLASPYQQELMHSLASAGATRNALTKGMIEDFEVPCPPVAEQQSIADILSALDDRIALLRETNATLESIAQAIFKSWFIDFDPVKARQQGEEPQGMDAATAALFPDAFQDSELGAIPAGWEVKPFGEFIERLSVGKKYSNKTVLSIGEIPVLDQGKSGVIGFHNDPPSVRASADSPVVVFANHTCYMRLISYNFSAIQNVLPFVGKDVSTIWAYFATKGRISFTEYKGHWPDFVIEKSVVPPSNVSHLFKDVVSPSLKRHWMNKHKIQTLASIRDALLPRLISGKLRLPEAEAMAGEAGL